MITEEDRKKYEHYTDGAILGIKLIGGLQDHVLLDIKDGWMKHRFLSQPGEKFQNGYVWAITILMGDDTNQYWILGQVGEELKARGLVDRKTSDLLDKDFS